MIHSPFRHPLVALLSTAGLLGLVAIAAGFGPLNPPAGAVTGTAKPLSEVEPRIAINSTNLSSSAGNQFIINQPGSYYLAGNITGETGKNCIIVLATDVTIDLNGFALTGVTGSLSAVNYLGGASVGHLTVLNGTIRNWAEEGVRTSAAPATICRFDGLRVTGNIQGGLSAGPGSTITNCTVTSCAFGISVGSGSTVSGCVVRANTGTGMSVGQQSTVTNCTVSANATFGLSLGEQSTVRGCTLTGNGTGILAGRNATILHSTINTSTSGPGISTTVEGLRVEACTLSANNTFGVLSDTPSNLSDAAIVGCTIRDNVAGGISSESNTQVLSCNVTGNGVTVPSPGIRVTDGSSIIDCNANNNSAGGIIAGAGATVSRCNAYQNTGSGISVGGSSSILDSTARLNTVDGVLFSFRCQVRGNNSGSNTFSQFHATNTDNRIEGNTAVSGSIGFDIDVGGNIVTRNSATNATTNWDIVAGNVALVVNAAVSPAISGNAGGAAPGSTDPNANFTY